MNKCYLPCKGNYYSQGATQPRSGSRTPSPCYLAKHKAVQRNSHGPDIQGLQEKKELRVRAQGAVKGDHLLLPV